MKDIATLRQELEIKLDEAKSIRAAIIEEDSRIWKQKLAERQAKVEKEFGSVIAEINTKIKEAAELLSQANQLGKKTWKGVLKNNPEQNLAFGVMNDYDLDTIEDMIDLQPIVDQLYEAGVEQITY